MARLRDPDRFSLPVATFIRQRLKEEYPNVPVGPSSAIGDALVTPAQFLLQPFRDELNVLKRNMSLLNYQTMLDEEMDRFGANYFVERRTGERAYGTVRVFFEDIQPVQVNQNAVFFDDENHRWNPISSITLTAEELALNLIPDTGEYYVDVPVVAEAVGPEYSAEAEQVRQLSGIVGAARCTNLQDFSTGKADDTNTDLVIAVKDSVTNNELATARAIRKVLRENFASIRSLQVVGFGDDGMERDVVSAVVSMEKLIPYSYARKYNLPLDGNGEVNWFDDDGNVVVSPVGGVVGAVEDLTGLDFNALEITLDGQVEQIVSVQPGYRVRMYQAAGVPNDPDEGDYAVRRVEEVPVEPNGVPIKVVRLDRPFLDPNIGAFNPVTDSQKYQFAILGPVAINQFHVGGKIDVYVDSAADLEESTTVSSLPETSPGSGVAEVPIVEDVPTVDGLPLFENNKAFFLPFLGVVKIEQVAADNDQTVERTLVEGAHYAVISARFRSRFTTQAYDVIRIFGNDENGNPLFIGKRIKISYLTNRDIPLMQAFVDNADNRNRSADIDIFAAEKIFLDVILRYSSETLDLDTAKTLVARYIQAKEAGAEMTTQEISLMLGLVGASDVEHPIRLRTSRQTGTGQVEIVESEDRIDIETFQTFYPVDELSIERVG